MQPDRNNADWQQPKQQPSQAPYTATPPVAPPQTPVVTLTPDTSAQPDVAATPASAEPQPETPVSPEAADTAAAPVSTASQSAQEPVHWQAHEYIHHDKNPVWFILFALITLALLAAAIFLMQSITFAVLVPVMAVAVIVYSRRPPRLLNYTLSSQGLHINDKLYPFLEFKGFGVIHDGDEYSVMLLPVKRFRPGVSVYFPEESGEAIVDMLGARLPMQELHLDIIDKVTRKLRI